MRLPGRVGRVQYLLLEPRAYVNVDLLQQALAAIDEPMRRTGLHNYDVARRRIPDFIPGYKSRGPFLHDDDFIVLVEM